MQAILDAIRALDDAQDVGQVGSYLLQSGIAPAALIPVFDRLMAEGRYAPAFQLASLALGKGCRHWPMDLMAILGCCRQGVWTDAFVALERFRDSLDEAPLAESVEALMDHPAVTLIIRNLILALREENPERNHLMVLMEVLKDLFPQIRGILEDGALPCNDPRHPVAAEEGQLLLSFDRPPEGVRRHHRVLLGMRQYFTGRPGSREFEMPPRLEAAMTRYGWDFTFHPVTRWDEPDKAREQLAAVAEHCRQNAIDVLIWDVEMDADAAASMIWLRQQIPGLFVIAFTCDPWEAELASRLRALAEAVDCIWSLNPSLPVWREPCFAGKMALFPFPPGVEPPAANVARKQGFGFAGSIEGFNWTRAVWLAQARMVGRVDIQVDRSTHQEEGLSPMDSYRAFMARLAGHYASVNFSLRRTMQRTVTGRTFEVLASDGLLIQEQTPDLDYYMVAGRDYLRFETFEDLVGIADFLRNFPDQAEQIRLNGSRLMHSVYDDISTIGYLDEFIFRKAGR